MCQTGKPFFVTVAITAFACSIWGCFGATCFAQLPTIEVTALNRVAGQQGSNIELQVRGNRLDELSELIGSGPGLTSTARTTPPRLHEDVPGPTNAFDLSLAKDCQPGLVDLRALGRFGLSNPRRFLVTSQPVELCASNHTDIATPVPLTGNAIFVDRCVPQRLNYFSLNLQAGERLDCVAYAKPLDSQASLVLILLDSQGSELARGRSKGAWPAEIHHGVEKTAGEHFVVVHDLLYRGGDEYAYVLEAATSASASQAASLELDQLLRPSIGSSSTASTEPLADLVAPFEATGNFADPASTQFDFVAKAGQQLGLEVRSSSEGALTDPRILLYKLDASNAAEPVQLAEQDDASPLGGPAVRIRRHDPELHWTAPEDGSYRIVVRDNLAGDRAHDATEFMLSVSSYEPNFELVAYRPYPTNAPAAARPWGSNLMRGGTEAIEVLAIRHGYNGAIKLAVEGLPASVTCQPIILPDNATQGTLVLRGADDAASWRGELRIVGRAKISDEDVDAVAASISISAPANATRNAVQYRDSDSVMAAVNPNDTAPLLVELGDGSTLEVAQGAKLSIPVRVTRREGGKAECLLRPQSLPPKTTLAETKVPADASEAVAELNVAADAPVGEYTVWMQNETKVRFRLNPQALEREEAYLAKLKTMADSTTDEASKQQIGEAVTKATARVEELKKLSAEQEFTVWLPSTPQNIRIVPKP